MSVREYIGARYITKFADPIEHDSTKTYEPLIIVQYQGASYVSRMYVPAGIPITDTHYWLLVADYNAQIAQYRNEVEQVAQDVDALEAIIPASAFSSTETVKDYIDNVDDVVSTLQDTIGGDYSPENTIATAITDIQGDISDISGEVSSHYQAIQNMSGDIDNLEGIIPASAFTSSNTVKDAIDNLSDTVGDISDALPLSAFDSTHTVGDALQDIDTRLDVIDAMFPMYTDVVNVASHSNSVVHVTEQMLIDALGVSSFDEFLHSYYIINLEQSQASSFSSGRIIWGSPFVVQEITTDNYFPYPSYSMNTQNKELMVGVYNSDSIARDITFKIVFIKLPYNPPS